jgi:heat-inducible transcriptional repressor
MERLEGKSKGTLLTVVRTYIVTGEPVGSRTVSRQWPKSISAASIRNIMLDLEEDGWLEQPHTSAGRVPTEKAYRYYADQFDSNERPAKQDEDLIMRELGTHLSSGAHHSEEEIFEKTSRVLSVISSNLGVVIRQPAGKAVLEHIHFSNLGDRRILVLLVSPGVPILHRMIRVDVQIPQSELGAAADYLNANFQGWELERIREELCARLAAERHTVDSLVMALRQLNERGILAETSSSDVFMEGACNFVGRPELADPAHLRDLIHALEAKENLVRLLNECLAVKAGTENQNLQVLIGLPAAAPEMRHFALVGAQFPWPGGTSGRMAVLGPARMPYDRAIQAIGLIVRLFRQQAAN